MKLLIFTIYLFAVFNLGDNFLFHFITPNNVDSWTYSIPGVITMTKTNKKCYTFNGNIYDIKSCTDGEDFLMNILTKQYE